MNRAQKDAVLSRRQQFNSSAKTISHRGHPNPPARCLAKPSIGNEFSQNSLNEINHPTVNLENNKIGLNALLTPENSVLVLIDHQAFQFANTRNMDPTMILNNTIGLAKAAKVFKVPTILTTVTSDRGGKLPQSLQAVFPDQVPIDRTTLNSWEDSRVVDLVKKTGRKKIIFAALWTEICLAYPAIHAMGDGYDVYVVTDASGGVSVEAHERAIQRLVQAGAVPVTWMGVLSEWQRDWAREATVGAVAEIMFAHGGATGTSIAWEFQLLTAAGQKK